MEEGGQTSLQIPEGSYLRLVNNGGGFRGGQAKLQVGDLGLKGGDGLCRGRGGDRRRQTILEGTNLNSQLVDFFCLSGDSLLAFF